MDGAVCASDHGSCHVRWSGLADMQRSQLQELEVPLRRAGQQCVALAGPCSMLFPVRQGLQDHTGAGSPEHGWASGSCWVTGATVARSQQPQALYVVPTSGCLVAS